MPALSEPERQRGLSPDPSLPLGLGRTGVFALFVLVALVVPVFAHGCHGDDVDHEPGTATGATRETHVPR